MLNNVSQGTKSIIFFLMAIVFNFACIVAGRLIEQLSKDDTANSIRINALLNDTRKMLIVSIILCSCLWLLIFLFQRVVRKLVHKLMLGYIITLISTIALIAPGFELNRLNAILYLWLFFYGFLGCLVAYSVQQFVQSFSKT